MSEQARQPGTPLPPGTPIFRGLRASGWRDAHTGEVRPVAFLRRQDEEHVSVSESVAGAVGHLRRHYGAADLTTDCVRRASDDGGDPLGLDVIADPILSGEFQDPNHAGITGIPPWAPPGTTGEQAALEAALSLIRACRPRVVQPGLE
jgi:hypothetical protein